MTTQTIVNQQVETKSESDQLNDLYAALAKAQGEIELASADSSNPFFKSKYANLAAIVKVSRDPLSKNGLSIIQRVQSNQNNQMFLFSRLCHASGQWIEAKMPINPPKSDIQSIGSYITYLRRYNLASLVGITVGEEDDDGEEAMKDVRSNKVEINAKITPDQVRELEKLLFDLTEEDEKAMIAWCQISELSEMPQSKFLSSKKALEKKLEAKNKMENK